jgi:hypothetical protein
MKWVKVSLTQCQACRQVYTQTVHVLLGAQVMRRFRVYGLGTCGRRRRPFALRMLSSRLERCPPVDLATKAPRESLQDSHTLWYSGRCGSRGSSSIV